MVRRAVDFPAPDTPVTTTSLIRAASLDVVPPAALARVGERAIEALLKLARRVVAAHLQEAVARRHLDERADVATRADGDAQERHRHVQDRVDHLVEAQPIVALALI